jgi:hypothetical protein
MGLLIITRYASSTGPYSTECKIDPAWREVEDSIRALDRNLFPFIWMFRDSAADASNDIPDFEVVGGDGEYFVAVRGEGYDLTFTDPRRGNEEIDVWISDQGASFPASNVCPDLERVLEAARVFFVNGTPCGSIPWGPA